VKEPVWETIPDTPENRLLFKDDLVWVVKKSRGKFGKLSVAIPGDHGVVISKWTSSMGSSKVCILTEDIREVATTQTCIRKFGSLWADEATEYSSIVDWHVVKRSWVDKTYVPLIIMRELQTGRRPKGKYVISRAGNSMLIKFMNSDDKMWLSQDKVHPDDWEVVMKSDERCHSVRVPQWLAVKGGAFGSVQ